MLWVPSDTSEARNHAAYIVPVAVKITVFVSLGSGSSFARLASSRLRKRSSLGVRSEEHTSELQSRLHLVCRLLLEKKKKTDLPEHSGTLPLGLDLALCT